MGGVIKKIIFKSGAEALPTSNIPKSFFDFKIKDIQGTLIDFNTYKNEKVIMVVNVACK